MKHFTLSLAFVFLLTGNFAYGQSERFRTTSKSKTEKPEKSLKFIMKSAAETGVWKPKKETLYEPDIEGEGDAWIEYATVDNEYDGNGNNISTTEKTGEEQFRTLTEYDAYNNRIKVTNQKFENNQWINDKKAEYAYDTIVKDYQTERRTYNWNPETNQWELNYSHKKEITRNAKGYVTQMSVKLLDDKDQHIEVERTEIAYSNGDLPATSWKLSQANEQNQFVEMTRYDKINWDRSDGQILVSNEAFMLGNNRIKKADIYDEGIKTATYTCTYVDGKTDFDCLMKSTNSDEEIRQKLTELDENGSYKEEIIEKLDEEGDGQLTTYEQYMIVNYDDHKNLLSEKYFEVIEGEPEQTDGTKILYTYGPAGEIAVKITQAYNYELGEYMDMEKITASDFVFFASGINNTQVNNNSLKVFTSENHISFEMEGVNSYFIYSSTGKLVSNGQVENNQGKVSVSGLPAGLYFIKAIGNNHSETVKFIKK